MSIEEKYLNLFDGKDDSFTFRLELLSPLIINDDMKSCKLYDDLGLFIPGSIIRGALKYAAFEVVESLEDSQSFCGSIDDIGTLFGTSNSRGLLIFTNCYIENYFQNYSEITQMKYFSSIDGFTGTVNHKLYTVELLKENNVFFGKIKVRYKIECKLLILLVCAIKNMRRIGARSHCGYGSIKCDLIDERGMIINEKYINNLKCQSLIK